MPNHAGPIHNALGGTQRNTPQSTNEEVMMTDSLRGIGAPPPGVESEPFTNLSLPGVNVDLILKSIFFGAIFYLLSLPELYKMTAGMVGKKVDGVLVHALVYAVLYYILVHFI